MQHRLPVGIFAGNSSWKGTRRCWLRPRVATSHWVVTSCWRPTPPNPGHCNTCPPAWSGSRAPPPRRARSAISISTVTRLPTPASKNRRRGAYQNPQYWQDLFVDDGRSTFAEAMSRFVDQSGRPGPGPWIGGHYPEDLGDDPVSGVSWYEAAAFARWAGRNCRPRPTGVWRVVTTRRSSIVRNWVALRLSRPSATSAARSAGRARYPSAAFRVRYGVRRDRPGRKCARMVRNDAAIGKVVRGGAGPTTPMISARSCRRGPCCERPAMVFEPPFTLTGGQSRGWSSTGSRPPRNRPGRLPARLGRSLQRLPRPVRLRRGRPGRTTHCGGRRSSRLDTGADLRGRAVR